MVPLKTLLYGTDIFQSMILPPLTSSVWPPHDARSKEALAVRGVRQIFFALLS
jgi:hypothetical protein